jgi:hypothetical protein
VRRLASPDAVARDDAWSTLSAKLAMHTLDAATMGARASLPTAEWTRLRPQVADGRRTADDRCTSSDERTRELRAHAALVLDPPGYLDGSEPKLREAVALADPRLVLAAARSLWRPTGVLDRATLARAAANDDILGAR